MWSSIVPVALLVLPALATVTPDNTCGGTNKYTCNPAGVNGAGGGCCSANGYCGMQSSSGCHLTLLRRFGLMSFIQAALPTTAVPAVNPPLASASASLPSQPRSPATSMWFQVLANSPLLRTIPLPAHLFRLASPTCKRLMELVLTNTNLLHRRYLSAMVS